MPHEHIFRDYEAMGRYRVGDHLVQPGAFGNRGATHHALYVGNENVMHYSTAPGVSDMDKARASVRIDRVQNLERKACKLGETVKVREHESRLPVDQSLALCNQRLGEAAFNIFSNNCEHLINWCVTGEAISHQTGLPGRIPAARVGYSGHNNLGLA
jgi:hypothetical protein